VKGFFQDGHELEEVATSDLQLAEPSGPGRMAMMALESLQRLARDGLREIAAHELRAQWVEAGRLSYTAPRLLPVNESFSDYKPKLNLAEMFRENG
jgi:hypothetical protein